MNEFDLGTYFKNNPETWASFKDKTITLKFESVDGHGTDEEYDCEHDWFIVFNATIPELGLKEPYFVELNILNTKERTVKQRITEKSFKVKLKDIGAQRNDGNIYFPLIVEFEEELLSTRELIDKLTKKEKKEGVYKVYAKDKTFFCSVWKDPDFNGDGIYLAGNPICDKNYEGLHLIRKEYYWEFKNDYSDCSFK